MRETGATTEGIMTGRTEIEAHDMRLAIAAFALMIAMVAGLLLWVRP